MHGGRGGSPLERLWGTSPKSLIRQLPRKRKKSAIGRIAESRALPPSQSDTEIGNLSRSFPGYSGDLRTTTSRAAVPRRARISGNVQWFRGGLVFKLIYFACHSTLGLIVIPKKNKDIRVRGLISFPVVF